MSVLLLDFDGVLNSTQTEFLSGLDFQQYPDADIIKNIIMF